ncbi:porin family protein [Algoriphagus halophilus]|uniref:Outer membrane protein beta-barrel domain-containing protein n=1 Tax=Algoriphagus halophilus TaxID=226505 RepID=A0A1N6ED75_9BACT|nr:outer membrane beta-barrel protein [Algoriphagus halophilus]SIN80956.1 Outer membrane protein beta-barrel domain-containing protein [Algoriphagus halophilus]
MSENFFDKSDKELDELLKKISESADIPFSEKDWSDMESRLDQNLSNGAIDWKTSILSWVAALLLVGALLSSIWERQDPIQEYQTEQHEGFLEPIPLENNTPQESPISVLEGDESGKSAFEESYNESSPLSGPATFNPIYDQESFVGNSYAENRGLDHPIPVSERNGAISIRSLEGLDKSLEKGLTTFSFEAPLQEDIKKVSKQGSKQGKEQFGGKFNISVQVAPDISAIQIDQFRKAGNMVGLGVEYFIRSKLSISTGVYYSYKPYSGDQGYHSNYGYEPTYIIGACDLLDIPLNLRYYPFEGKVQRFFISAGVSSYLMLKEKYELEYYNEDTGYPYTRELEVKGANQHFLGIANISVGYERKLGRQISLQVEPYFKVPFSGVGEGDVSLKSTGIFIGLKFYPSQTLK